MDKRRLFSYVFMFAAIRAFSFEWPVADPVLLSTFGGLGTDQFQTFITIESGDADVHPVLSGEIVFYNDTSLPLSALPSGLGSYIVVQHEGGLRSIYSHLEEGSVLQDKREVRPYDVLGKTGETGASQSRNVALSIIDMEAKQIVNPLLLLPSLEDKGTPVINGVFFRDNDELDQVRNYIKINAGTVSFYARMYDPGQNVRFFNPLSPYQILVYINGVERNRIIFEGVREQDGFLVLADSLGRTWSDFYTGDGLVHLGNFTLPPGEVRIEISVSDYSGNEATRLYLLNIEKEG